MSGYLNKQRSGLKAELCYQELQEDTQPSSASVFSLTKQEEDCPHLKESQGEENVLMCVLMCMCSA